MEPFELRSAASPGDQLHLGDSGTEDGAARPGDWWLAALWCDVGPVGADVHDLYGCRLERRHEHRFGPAEYQLVRLVRVGRSASRLHEQRVLHGATRIQQPAAG